MDVAIDDINEFTERIRRRRLKRVAIFGTLAFTCWLVYHRYHPRLDALIAFPEAMPPDDPRVLLSASSASGETPDDLRWFRTLFSREFPRYLREFRRYRNLNARHPGSDDGARLASARSRLLDFVRDDKEIQAVVSVIVSLAEQDLAGHETRIFDLFDSLNVILEGRALPFFAEAELAGTRPPTLQVRFFEVVARSRFRIAEDIYPARFIDRLDLMDFYRNPDQLPWHDDLATVPVRAVLAQANRGLLGALHPDGCWCLSRVDPPASLAWAEPAIGKAVFEHWRQHLEETVSPSAWSALVKVSTRVANRNRIFRAANQRDPDHIVTLSPSSVRLNDYGEAWLEEMKPYAARGLVRLQLEDMARLRINDKAIAEDLDAAAPALQAVLRERLRLAAAGEVHRVHLVHTNRMPPRIRGRVGGRLEDTAGVGWVVESLSWLASTHVSCAATVGDLVFDAVDGPHGEASAWVLAELSGLPIREDDLDATTLSSVLKRLLETPCDDIKQKARSLYEQHFGPWHDAEPTEIVGIARQVGGTKR